MIYKYDTRYIVTYSNGNRASFSKKRYGPLLEKISLLSEKIDHNPLNNMKNNLSICDSYSDNNINLSLSSKNTSGYTGVSFIKGKWRARIQFKGTEHTEFFSSKEKAIECRQKWEKELRGF